ncbi:MAG: hypothetical protein WBM44_28985 [Waterburya sp.]
MLRDASHQQVIQKFSFIESLNLSRKVSQNTQPNLDKVNSDQTFTFQQQSKSSDQALAVKTEDTETEASAIVATSNTSSTISDNWYETDSTAYGLSLAEIVNSASGNSIDHNLSKKHNYLGKVLFALASSYCLFVLWWLLGHQGNRLLIMLTGGKQIVLSNSDIQFIDYMERSLDKIDRQLEAKQEASDNDDVVYVPVYTPAPATAQVPQIASNNLPLTTLPSSNAPALPSPEPAPLQSLQIPAPPPLPAPTNLSNNTEQNNQIATANKPTIKHTLIGTLELGEGSSAALVKIQGKTRRVWLGEEINTDGWILESVGNQRAKISYQGQVRSIAVGETF